MLVIPAIDILGGKCVRLAQGKYTEVTTYSADPVEVARTFAFDGAQFLHIVDLDGAKYGVPANMEIIRKITSLGLGIQVGGGIRDFETAKAYLESGVNRVILGTCAFSQPSLIRELIRKFGSDRIVVSVDMCGQKLAIKGWRDLVAASFADILEDLKEMGIKLVIVTDVKRDGMLNGPNFNLLKKVVNQGFKVIAAGGVSTQKDISTLKNCGVYAAIVGKAIYEGKIDLSRLVNANGLTKRIIPCMDIDKGRVVKGVYFKELRDAGDPIELAKYYSDTGADELVFLDITATMESRNTLYDLVGRIAGNINIPFTVGGGVKNLEDIRCLLNAGADKIAICSAAIKNPDFVRAAAKKFGSQCIVISLDCKKSGDGWRLYIKGGREETGLDAIAFAKKMERFGAGELLVNSLDRDGTKTGYDIELLRCISGSVNIPIIASSGAGSKEDFLKAFTEGRADAGLAASLFHYKELSIPRLKKYLKNNNVEIRL